MAALEVLRLFSTLRLLKDVLLTKDDITKTNIIGIINKNYADKSNELFGHLIRIRILVNKGKGTYTYNEIGLNINLCEKIYKNVYGFLPEETEPIKTTGLKENTETFKPTKENKPKNTKPMARISDIEKIERTTKMLKHLYSELLLEYKSMNIPDMIVRHSVPNKWVLSMKLIEMGVISKLGNGRNTKFIWNKDKTPNKELAEALWKEVNEYAKISTQRHVDKKNGKKILKKRGERTEKKPETPVEGKIVIGKIQKTPEIGKHDEHIEKKPEIIAKGEFDASRSQRNTGMGELKKPEKIENEIPQVKLDIMLEFDTVQETVVGYFDSIEVRHKTQLVKLNGLTIASVPKGWLIIKTLGGLNK